MSSTPTVPAIHGTITVGVPVDRAFHVFTESFNTCPNVKGKGTQRDVVEGDHRGAGGGA